jgi:hypothetical protein
LTRSMCASGARLAPAGELRMSRSGELVTPSGKTSDPMRTQFDPRAVICSVILVSVAGCGDDDDPAIATPARASRTRRSFARPAPALALIAQLPITADKLLTA